MTRPHAPRIVKERTWVAYLIAAIALPCLFLLFAEAVLRLFNIGYDPRFFYRVKSPDGVFCTDNPAFTRRFFPPALVRPLDKLRFSERKADNVRRIFVLGSSAAQGEPAPAFAFSRNLDLMLRDRYGSTRCEVINTAITAINSHVVLPIARECSRLSPDLFIVYTGNNEVIGPFGPGTVFSHNSGMWFIRLRVFLSSTRLGQLASEMSRSFRKREGVPSGWGGLKMFLHHKFRFNDPAMNGVYQNYRENLRDICRAARSGGARVMLCTIASNTKECGPFFSAHRRDLSPDTLLVWERLYKNAVDSQQQGRFEAALAKLTKAAALDSTHADMRYRMGQCLAELGRSGEARQHFIAARDQDALRFRADSRLNLVIREVAREFAECAVVLDMEAIMAGAEDAGSYEGTPFLEHVHYTFHGNYLFAANTIALIDSLIGAPLVAPPAVTEAACRERLAFTPWEELKIDREIFLRLTKPPFTGQEDNRRRAHWFMEEIRRLTAQVNDSVQRISAMYGHAAALEPRDWRIRDLHGRYLLENGLDAAAAEQQFRAVLDTVSHDHVACNNLAIALERQGRIEEAIEWYRRAVMIDPLFIDAYINMADDLAIGSRFDEARQSLRQALRINPAHPGARERYAQLQLMRKKDVPDLDRK